MFKLSEAAKWNEDQCATHIAKEAVQLLGAPHVVGGDLTEAVIVAATDAWADSVGALHKFAARVRAFDADALGRVLRLM